MGVATCHPEPGCTNSKLPLICEGTHRGHAGADTYAGSRPQPTLPAPTRAGFQELGDRGKQRVKVARTEGKQKAEAPSPHSPGAGVPSVPAGGHHHHHHPPTLPVILSLQELEFVFDPVTGLGHSEFKSRLPGLMGSLEPRRTTQGRGVGTSDGLHEAPCLRWVPGSFPKGATGKAITP